MLTIAVIDKHPVARVGLSCMLKEFFSEINLLESECPGSFLELFPGIKPDLVILGFSKMTTPCNRETLNFISSNHLNWLTIILDEEPDADLVAPFFKAHVSGYMSKQNDISEIIHCINLVLDGKRYVGIEMMDAVIRNFVAQGGPADHK